MQALIRISMALALLSLFAGSALAAKDEYWTNIWGQALRGYDPVAYFTAGRPVEGKKRFEIEWMDAEWRFTSEENMEQFQANPEKYAPQYGGYCAWAVAQGYTASIDPEAWKIVDGKLYLNYDEEVQDKWEQDIPGFIEKANTNWPGVLR
jgi:YHS domain-containing protein